MSTATTTTNTTSEPVCERVVACVKCGREITIPAPPADLPDSIRNASIKNIACENCRKAEAVEESTLTRKQRIDREILRITPVLYRRTIRAKLPAKSQAAVQQVLDWKYGPKGLLLVGETGLGKTRAAYMLIEQLIRNGYEVEAFSPGGVNFGSEVSKQFSDLNAAAAWLHRLKTVKVVFIDDLGKWTMTDRVANELFALFEARTSDDLPIIATMNPGSLDTLKPDLRKPLKRRIKDFCRVVSFDKTN